MIRPKSTLAFITAVGALGAGKEVGIALLGEAVYLVKEGVANTVHGVGFPPLPELIEKVVKGNRSGVCLRGLRCRPWGD